jgi:hypothetical protein
MHIGLALQLFGFALAVVCWLLLVAWYYLNWPVDPFLATLFLVSTPFFIAMGWSMGSGTHSPVKRTTIAKSNGG